MSQNGHGPTPTLRQALAWGALALDAQADGMPDADEMHAAALVLRTALAELRGPAGAWFFGGGRRYGSRRRAG